MKRSLFGYLALAVVTMGLAVQASGQPVPPAVRPSPSGPPTTLTPHPNASLTEVQELIRQFNAQRTALLEKRKADLARLQNATATERDRILAEMRALQGQRLEEQKELARKLRDELKDLREKRRGGG